jgi:similar to stage IV sporulation protein
MIMLFGGKTAGYVRIKVKDGDIAGLLNRLMSKNIPVWHIEKGEEGVVFSIPLPQLKKARRLAHSCGCYITIAGRGGLPFFYRKALKMRYVWLMAFVCVGLLILFTSSILQVKAVREDQSALDEDLAAAVIQRRRKMGCIPSY